MNPILIAVGVATTALLTLLSAAAPLIRGLLKQQFAKAELERLRDALRAASFVVSAAVKLTPTDLDDGLARVLDLAAKEVGEALIEKYRAQAVAFAAELHANPAVDVHLGSGSAVKAVLDAR